MIVVFIGEHEDLSPAKLAALIEFGRMTAHPASGKVDAPKSASGLPPGACSPATSPAADVSAPPPGLFEGKGKIPSTGSCEKANLPRSQRLGLSTASVLHPNHDYQKCYTCEHVRSDVKAGKLHCHCSLNSLPIEGDTQKVGCARWELSTCVMAWGTKQDNLYR